MIQIQNQSPVCAQHCVQWTGGYAARFLGVFAALGFLRLDGESRPSHLYPAEGVRGITRAAGQLSVANWLVSE
jgi:hypothetical protein